jgi:hypothetical protein
LGYLQPFTLTWPKIHESQNHFSEWTDFTHPIYDFDEFMADCQAAGCTPIIVVAYDGIYKPATGNGQALTRQQALETSAAWVNYANNVKGYNINSTFAAP